MAIGLKVGKKYFEIGSASFFKCFFSTIYKRLENDWGKSFPIIMNNLYNGYVSPDESQKAINELVEIQNQLKNFSPDLVVWDFENLSEKPPWKDKISPNITSLSNYFWTSNGKNLMSVLIEAFEESQKVNKPVTIE